MNAPTLAPVVEQRIVLQRVGRIDPEKIEDYLAERGYEALTRVLRDMRPGEVIEEVRRAGLRGHGGAGFPTGTKWGFVAREPGPIRYVICNADESEPGTFKDRLIMEGDPHSVVEAMIIAGYAVRASEGFIYIRGEYPLATARVEKAIRQAEAHGYLGQNILGSGFDFTLHVHSGAGAYICGEETALIESLEGKRGEPRNRPPHPTTSGLWGKPTLVNNVETLTNVPPILRHGAEWYRGFGTVSSPGTQVFALLGNVNVRGAFEVPFGVTAGQLIETFGQGVKGGALKLVQIGGSSGFVVPPSLVNVSLNFDSAKAGVSLGSGTLLVCNEHTCVVDLMRVVMKFFRKESCGKCVPCRVGTVELHLVLERIAHGRATPRDLETLEMLAVMVQQTSFCGLGASAPNALITALQHFREEFVAHIEARHCPAGVCPMVDVPAASLAAYQAI